EGDLVDDPDVLGLDLGQDRAAGGEPAGLLGHRLAPLLGALVLRVAAADADRLADAALAGVAGALLAVDLAGRAGDLAAGLRPDRALPLVRVVHDQRLLQQVRPHLAAQPLLVHLQGVDLLAGLVEYGDFNHLWS